MTFFYILLAIWSVFSILDWVLTTKAVKIKGLSEGNNYVIKWSSVYKSKAWSFALKMGISAILPIGFFFLYKKNPVLSLVLFSGLTIGVIVAAVINFSLIKEMQERGKK